MWEKKERGEYRRKPDTIMLTKYDFRAMENMEEMCTDLGSSGQLNFMIPWNVIKFFPCGQACLLGWCLAKVSHFTHSKDCNLPTKKYFFLLKVFLNKLPMWCNNDVAVYIPHWHIQQDQSLFSQDLFFYLPQDHHSILFALFVSFLPPSQRTSLSALEWSEQQIRKAASLEELLRITHSEDWKLWKCRLKLKSVATLDSRSASHRSTRFAAAFYDIEILKGRWKAYELQEFLVLNMYWR